MRTRLALGAIAAGLALVACGGGGAAGGAALAVEPRPSELFESRSAEADAESIAEEGARDAIVALIPVFERIGIVVEHRGDGVFRARNAGGDRVELVERLEGEAVILETGGATYPIVDGDGDGERATRSVLSALDHVLEALGATHRAYARHLGASEQRLVIMTPEERADFDARHPAAERLEGSR